MHRNLSAEDIRPLVDALLAALPEDHNSTVITVKAENIPLTPPNGPKPVPNNPHYDPGVVYIVEFCTMLVSRDEVTISQLGKPVVEALMEILRDSSRYNAITVSRAAFYVLTLLRLSYVSMSLFV
jgi:golgi-specific brefeldin A-resistance guanine nucleotide exchange factor 1